MHNRGTQIARKHTKPREIKQNGCTSKHQLYKETDAESQIAQTEPNAATTKSTQRQTHKKQAKLKSKAADNKHALIRINRQANAQRTSKEDGCQLSSDEKAFLVGSGFHCNCCLRCADSSETSANKGSSAIELESSFKTSLAETEQSEKKAETAIEARNERIMQN